jgi:hypothetical protein
MELAELTPLQFVVVQLLFGGPKTPGELRKALEELGVGQSLGSFSRLVRRLEWSQWLDVAYEKPGRGRRLRECRLAVTDLGLTGWNATRDFFARFSPPPADFVPVPTDEGRLAHLPARVRKSILNKQTKKDLSEVLEQITSTWIAARRPRRP